MKIEEEALENAANCLGKHLSAVIAAFERVQSELESSEVFDTQKLARSIALTIDVQNVSRALITVLDMLPDSGWKDCQMNAATTAYEATKKVLIFFEDEFECDEKEAFNNN